MNLEFGVARIDELGSDRRAAIMDRSGSVIGVTDTVEEIISTVRAGGDAALVEYAAEFDDVQMDAGALAIDVATAADRDGLSTELRSAIGDAADNIRDFHRRQRPQDWRTTVDGRELGRRFRPIDRVGIYVPGGAAAYPSSALMGIIPAAVAGVSEIVAVTPPADEPNPITLAAMREAGVDEIYQVGGAQAIAALAYGTETIDPVDKIVGPGNRYVAAAKRAVQGHVDIDFVAGPSEILVVADETATPAYIAADIVAQAEHDPDACAALVTPNPELAATVVAAVEEQVADRERADIISEALAGPASDAFVAESRASAAAFGEAYAPEHLAIQTRDDEAVMADISSAGSVFLGPQTPVAAGDYASGTNHILPTGGGTRVHGGVAVDTFLRASTVQRLSATALADLRETITTLADAEGLEAHAESVHRRFEQVTDASERQQR